MPEKAPQQRLPATGARRELLELLAFLAHDKLDRALVADLAASLPGEHDPEAEISALLEDCVLEQDGSHLLIAEDLALRLREEMDPGLLRERSEQALSLLLAAVPEDPDDYRSWDACEAIYPHALGAVSAAEALELDAPAILGLLSFAAEYRASRGDLMLAQEIATRAARHSDPNRSDRLEVHWRRVLAELQRYLDESEDARLLLESALGLQHHLAEDDSELLRTHLKLADTLISLESLERAREELEPLLEVPAPSRLRIDIEETLGWLLEREGELEESNEAYQGALTRAEQELGAGHPDCGRVLYSLAVLGYQRGALAEARAWLDRAREITNATLGEDHPHAGFIAALEARVLLEQGEPRPARRHAEQALAIGEATFPPHHTSLWLRHRTNCEVLLAINAIAEAVHHAEQALAIAQEGPTSKPADVAISLSELASVERRRGDLAAAREHYQRSLTLTEAADEADEQMLAQRALALGETERDLGELEAAVEHLSASLLAYERLEGSAALQAAMPRLQLAELQAVAVKHAAAATGALGSDEDAELNDISTRVFSQTLTSVLAGLDAAPQAKSTEVSRICVAVADAGRHRAPQLSLEALERAGELADLSRTQRLALAAAWQRYGRARRDGDDLSAACESFESAAAMLDDLPPYQGVMLHDIGDVHYAAERFEAAIEAYRRAADRKAESPNSDPLDLGTTLIMLGRALEKAGDYDGAAETYERRLALLASLSQRDLQAEGVTLHDLADVRRAQARPEEAIELYRKAIERKREHGRAPVDLATSLMAAGRLLANLDRLDEASAAFEERVELLTSLEQSRLQIEGVALHDLADVRKGQGRFEEAIDLYTRAAERKREAGQDPADLTITLRALSRAHRDTGDHRRAEPVLEECLSILESLPERNLQAEGVVLHDLADCRVAQGREAEGLALYREAVERKREGGAETPVASLSASLLSLGALEMSLDQAAAAASTTAEAIELMRGAAQPDPYRLASALIFHAAALEDPEQGVSELLEALELLRDDDNTPPRELAALCMLCAETLKSAGRDEEAAAALASAERELERSFSEPGRPANPKSIVTLASMALESGSDEVAERCIDYMRAARRATPEDRLLTRSLCDGLRRLALHRSERGELDDARVLLEEALGALSGLDSTEYPREGKLQHEIGGLFRREGELTAAADHFRRAAERRREAGEDCPPHDLAVSLVALGKVELDQGGSEAALPLAEEALALLRSEAEPNVVGLCSASALRAEALNANGEPKDAIAVLEEAEAYLSDSGVDDPATLAILKMLAARAHRELGDDQRADELQAEFEQLNQTPG
jgi:tetratricopeptide (TPR) repeat protein